MSKEAIKLALEALGQCASHNCELERKAITALREALAQPDFWEGYVPEPVKPAQCAAAEDGVCEALDCSNHKPAQQALDKKAENARELGLDYEPAQQEPVAWEQFYPEMGKPKLAYLPPTESLENALYTSPPAQQEPVAWMVYTLDGKSVFVTDNPADFTPDHRALPLYTSPPAQRTWVGLVWGELPEDGQNHDFLRGAVWAETKLKEKNQ